MPRGGESTRTNDGDARSLSEFQGEWGKTVTIPEVPVGGVHLWRLDLATVDRIRLMQAAHLILNAEESIRAERFLVLSAREEYVAGRSLLRRLLGAAVGKTPGSVVLGSGSHGKPYLLEGSGLEFNVSHSKGVILIAVSRAGAVGVDVEFVDPSMLAGGELLEIADGALLPQEAFQIQQASSEREKLLTFYRFWTRKEAVAKADGRGIGVSLEYSLVEAEGRNGCWVTLREAAEDGRARYFVSSPRVGADHLAAVATLQEPQLLALFDAVDI